MSEHSDAGRSGSPLTVFYGGTFDPVHCGHLQVARQARDHLAADIHLMPAADPPHRPAPGASAEQRARMLDLAVADQPGLTVDRRELLRSTPSYSIDTLREVRAERGVDAPLALLIGADSLMGLAQWKDWQALFERAHFVVAGRPGIGGDEDLQEPLASFLRPRWTDAVNDLHASPAGRILRLRNRLHDGSATGVRARIVAGRPWRQLVPTAVADYIDRHKLYAGGGDGPASL